MAYDYLTRTDHDVSVAAGIAGARATYGGRINTVAPNFLQVIPSKLLLPRMSG